MPAAPRKLAISATCAGDLSRSDRCAEAGHSVAATLPGATSGAEFGNFTISGGDCGRLVGIRTTNA